MREYTTYSQSQGFQQPKRFSLATMLVETVACAFMIAGLLGMWYFLETPTNTKRSHASTQHYVIHHLPHE